MSAILVSARPAVVPVLRAGTATGPSPRAAERHLRLVPAEPVRAVAPAAARPSERHGAAASLRTTQAPLRLTRRGRVVAVVLSLLLVAAAGVLGSRAAADGPASARVVERHVVTAGETLWSIADSVTRPGQDVRDVVVQIEKLNGMSDSSLAAGEELVVPAAG